MIAAVYRREASGLKILYTTVSIIHKDYSEGEIEKWLNSRIRTVTDRGQRPVPDHKI